MSDMNKLIDVIQKNHETTVEVAKKSAVEAAETVMTKAEAEAEKKHAEIAARMDLIQKSIDDVNASMEKKSIPFVNQDGTINTQVKSKNFLQAMLNVNKGHEIDAGLDSEVVDHFRSVMSLNLGGADEASEVIACAMFQDVWDHFCRQNNIAQLIDIKQFPIGQTRVKFGAIMSKLKLVPVAECEPKPVTSLDFANAFMEYFKVAGIVIACDEFVDGYSLGDFWGLVREQFTEALEEYISAFVIGADGTNASYAGQVMPSGFYGIANATDANGFIPTNGYSQGGINTVEVCTDDVTATDYKTFFKMAGATDCCSKSGAAWVMHCSYFHNVIMMWETADGVPFVANSTLLSLQNGRWFLMGYPVYFDNAMPAPDLNDETNNVDKTFVLFGDFSNYSLYIKKGLNFSVSTEATIEGGTIDGFAGEVFSLWQRNAAGLLAEAWMGGIVTKPSAFVRLVNKACTTSTAKKEEATK